MKSIVTLLLVLLFASCGKQDVYEFESEKIFRKGHQGIFANKEIRTFEFTMKVRARFRIIDEDGICLYDFDDEIIKYKQYSGNPIPENERFSVHAGIIKFFDDKDFLLFQTDEDQKFSDSKDSDDKKTKIVTRALLERVDRIEFTTGEIFLFSN